MPHVHSSRYPCHQMTCGLIILVCETLAYSSITDDMRKAHELNNAVTVIVVAKVHIRGCHFTFVVMVSSHSAQLAFCPPSMSRGFTSGKRFSK